MQKKNKNPSAAYLCQMRQHFHPVTSCKAALGPPKKVCYWKKKKLQMLLIKCNFFGERTVDAVWPQAEPDLFR